MIFRLLPTRGQDQLTHSLALRGLQAALLVRLPATGFSSAKKHEGHEDTALLQSSFLQAHTHYTKASKLYYSSTTTLMHLLLFYAPLKDLLPGKGGLLTYWQIPRPSWTTYYVPSILVHMGRFMYCIAEKCSNQLFIAYLVCTSNF